MNMEDNCCGEPRKAVTCSEPLQQKLERTKDPQINANDVLCGRGKTSFNHVGNLQFRDTIIASIKEYNNAQSRVEKSMVVSAIVQNIRFTGGRFLKRDRSTGKWVELNNRKAKEKVGHAIRDAMSLIGSKRKKKNKQNAATSEWSPQGKEEANCSSLLSDSDSDINSDIYIDSYLQGSHSPLGSEGEIDFCFALKETDSSLCYTADDCNQNAAVPRNSNSNSAMADDDFLSDINDALGPMTIDARKNDPIQAFLARKGL